MARPWSPPDCWPRCAAPAWRSAVTRSGRTTSTPAITQWLPWGSDKVATPSRHLALIPASERDVEARRTVDALADLMAGSVGLDGFMTVARQAPPLQAEPWDPSREVSRVGGEPVVAIASGPAFT